jgi:hypothetical protein
MREREKMTEDTKVGTVWCGHDYKMSPEKIELYVENLSEPHRTWLLMRDEVEAYLKKLAHVTDGDSHGLVSSNISEEAVRLISKLGGAK